MEATLMAGLTFRLKSRDLFADGIKRGAINSMKDIERKVKADGDTVSYQTVHRMFQSPEAIVEMNMPKLADALVYGLGINPDILADMRFGDIFEIVQMSEQNGAE